MIEPQLFGSAFDLHPVVVMFCLVVWSQIWGVVGAILSVPLTCCLKLALKPLTQRHPYALILYNLMEFSLPDSNSMRDLFYEDGTPRGAPNREYREFRGDFKNSDREQQYGGGYGGEVGGLSNGKEVLIANHANQTWD
jgi:hypothetical protein